MTNRFAVRAWWVVGLVFHAWVLVIAMDRPAHECIAGFICVLGWAIGAGMLTALSGQQ